MVVMKHSLTPRRSIMKISTGTIAAFREHLFVVKGLLRIMPDA
jgi:hypothetical protein